MDTVVDGEVGLLPILSLWAVAVTVKRSLFYKRVELSHYLARQTLEMPHTSPDYS